MFAGRRGLAAFLLGYVAVGTALCFLYPDGSEQDAPTHFYFCRWAWKHPEFFVAPWPRPLFTTLYAFPALLGYSAAKILTVFIAAAAAWQTAAAAREMRLDRPWLAAPILLASPALFMLSIETMTEPLFALLLAVALRLHYRGSTNASLIVASFFPTVRPEGFLLALLFVIAALAREPRPLLRPLWLGLGSALWFAASWAVTRDPLFILHAWPWASTRHATVTNPFTQSPLGLASYLAAAPLIVGPLLLPFLVVGIARTWKDRRRLLLGLPVATVLLYSVLTALNVFSANASLRYVAPVAPAIALLILAGWRLRPVAGAAVLLPSLLIAVAVVDLVPTSRDVWAFRDAIDRLRSREEGRRMTGFVAGKMTPYILLDREPETEGLRPDARKRNIEIIRTRALGTVVMQDAGWHWFFRRSPTPYGIGREDYLAAGYRLLDSREYDLRPRLPWPQALLDLGLERRQRIDVYVRESP